MKNKIVVRLDADYDVSSLGRQSPSSSWQWENIELRTDKPDFCDVLLVLNYPRQSIEVECRSGGAWLFAQEPVTSITKYHQKSYKYFDRVYHFDQSKKFKNQYFSHTSLPWFVNRTYDELIGIKQDTVSKELPLSWITSNKGFLPGHKTRLRFLEELSRSSVSFDLFGKGYNPLPDKERALDGYYYSVAIENSSIPHYWTEKIADCFLSYTIPFYYGAPNIGEYFPPGSYVWLDIENPNKAIATIEKVLSSDYWAENFPALQEARELVLTRYQLFPHVYSLVDEFMQMESGHPSTAIKKVIPSPITRWYKAKKIVKKLWLKSF